MHGYRTFHEDIINNLIESVKNNASSHAYIFEGPKGLYKHESARLFAAVLTCLSHGDIPCGVCSSCIQAAANSNPDIIYIDKPKDKTRIPVDSIRRINEDAAIKPFNAPRKVYIINDGDLLTPEAQNAFLKTFEEPPEYAVFIIVAESAASLLPTILSRAVQITFPPVPNSRIEEWLLREHPKMREKVPFLVNFCEGIPGAAEDIISDPGFEELRSSSLDMLAKLMSSDKTDSFAIEEFIEKNKENAETVFSLWLSYLRDILVMQCGAFDNAVNVDKLSALRSLSAFFDEKKSARAIETLLEGIRMLDRHVKTSAVGLWCALKIKQA